VIASDEEVVGLKAGDAVTMSNKAFSPFLFRKS
jgi:hypothetical protein